MNAPLQYVAEISQVREVSLIGTADLAFWTERLQREKLFPTAVDGQAQILISGTSANFKGIPFQELSISVFVSREERRAEREGAFLTQAFNSNWFFALVERMWFATPYDLARVSVEATVPASIQVKQHGQIAFRSAMAEQGIAQRQAIRCGNEGWEGPIFLPGRRRLAGDKWFYARIGGQTSVYPFLPDRDELTIRPELGPPAIAWLVQSHFAGRQWIIRDSAVHAKSKTYARHAACAFPALQPALAAAE
ncbi:MAG TPA: hypothetical protein VMP01_15080 [Pirellulaceae bacterium]|nr:hypothetical protein [Pirellulaceae bacterium]